MYSSAKLAGLLALYIINAPLLLPQIVPVKSLAATQQKVGKNLAFQPHAQTTDTENMMLFRIKSQLTSSGFFNLSGNLPWWCLFSISAGLVLIALIAQEVYDYLPCVMCIYQRTSFMVIAAFSALALTIHNLTGRIVIAGAVIMSALTGATQSIEHIDILTSPMGAFIPCDIEPNFPTFLPLHQWLPTLFSAPGSCLDNRFQLLTLGMPQWALLWFITITLFTTTLLIRFIIRSPRR